MRATKMGYALRRLYWGRGGSVGLQNRYDKDFIEKKFAGESIFALKNEWRKKKKNWARTEERVIEVSAKCKWRSRWTEDQSATQEGFEAIEMSSSGCPRGMMSTRNTFEDEETLRLETSYFRWDEVDLEKSLSYESTIKMKMRKTRRVQVGEETYDLRIMMKVSFERGRASRRDWTQARRKEQGSESQGPSSRSVHEDIG